MRDLCIVAVMVGLCFLSANPAFAQLGGGYIRLYEQPEPFGCSITEPEGGGLMNVYVVHGTPWYAVCVDAVAFRVISGGGFTGTYVGETIHSGLVLYGDTQAGIGIGVIQEFSPVLVATVQYMTTGDSPSCSWLQIDESPLDGTLVFTCEGDSYQVYDGAKLTVNVVDPETCEHYYCTPVGTEATTWGSVKALYSN